MYKTEKISSLQLIMLIWINRFLFGFSFMPTTSLAPANQDAWIADILSGVLILIFAIPMLIMASKYPDIPFNEYFEIILGKIAGKIVNFIYAVYLLAICLLTVLLLSEFLQSAVIIKTPMYAIILFMLLPCMYASYKGIECIGRTTVIVAIFTFCIVILYAILNFNNMDFKELLPILQDSSFSKLAYGIFNIASRFSDCFVFFMLIPYVKKTKITTPTKLLLIVVTGFTIMNVIITISTQTVLGVGLARIFKYPYFVSIQQINLFGIIQRIEFFNVIAWINIFFFKLASTVFVSAEIFAQIFKTKSYKPFIIPMNLAIFIVILFTSISYYAIFREIINNYAHLIIFTTNFIIPSIILIVYLIRRKKLSTTNKEAVAL